MPPFLWNSRHMDCPTPKPKTQACRHTFPPPTSSAWRITSLDGPHAVSSYFISVFILVSPQETFPWPPSLKKHHSSLFIHWLFFFMPLSLNFILAVCTYGFMHARVVVFLIHSISVFEGRVFTCFTYIEHHIEWCIDKHPPPIDMEWMNGYRDSKESIQWRGYFTTMCILDGGN